MVWANLLLAFEWDMRDVTLGKCSLSCRAQSNTGSGPCACSKSQHSPSPSSRPVSLCQHHLLSLHLCCFTLGINSGCSWACVSWCEFTSGAGEAKLCLPKSELGSSGIGTSRSALTLLPDGAHLGLPPSFEPGQHIPALWLKTGQAKISHPSHTAGAKGLPCVCIPTPLSRTGSQGDWWSCI